MDNNNTITLIRQIIHPINKRHMSGGSAGTYVNKKLIKAYSEITL